MVVVLVEVVDVVLVVSVVLVVVVAVAVSVGIVGVVRAAIQFARIKYIFSVNTPFFTAFKKFALSLLWIAGPKMKGLFFVVFGRRHALIARSNIVATSLLDITPETKRRDIHSSELSPCLPYSPAVAK
jgi:predicted DNA repair protein MutK